jgi:Flp pilus assembly protein TadG
MGRRQRKLFSAQSMVEFALVGPLFFLMLIGTIEMGRLMWTSHELSNGTREGARWASVRGERSGANITDGQVKTVILAHTSALDGSLSVNVIWSESSREPGSKVRISTTYDYVPMVGGFLGIGTIELKRQSELTIHY